MRYFFEPIKSLAIIILVLYVLSFISSVLLDFSNRKKNNYDSYDDNY